MDQENLAKDDRRQREVLALLGRVLPDVLMGVRANVDRDLRIVKREHPDLGILHLLYQRLSDAVNRFERLHVPLLARFIAESWEPSTLSHELRPLTNTIALSCGLIARKLSAFHFDSEPPQGHKRIFESIIHLHTRVISPCIELLSPPWGMCIRPTQVHAEVFTPIFDEFFRSGRISIDHVITEAEIRVLSINMDADIVRIAVWEILDNAIKFAGAGLCKLRIAISENSDVIHLRFCDWGKGIPEGWEDRVFEFGEQVPGSLSAGMKGYGLGLTRVRYAMDCHQGSAHVTCRRDPTEVTLTFPRFRIGS